MAMDSLAAIDKEKFCRTECWGLVGYENETSSNSIFPAHSAGCIPSREKPSMDGLVSMIFHIASAADAALVICTICGDMSVIAVDAIMTANMTLYLER